MSAIAGIYNLNEEPISPVQTKKMMGTFLQYPADMIHTFHKDNIFLGCHGQWITPESIGEVLPLYDYERQIYITSDAIIDNRIELFEKLNIDVGKRKTITDAQLIVMGYCKWEEEVPKHLIGDFAFIIWDEKNRKLFGARDFSGSRTLYYYSDQSRVAFSTTIESLFTLPYVDKELNEEWIAEFITIPSMVDAIDTNSTVYKHIKQIPPSHSITITNNKINLSRYCNVVVGQKIKFKTDAEYEEAFKEVFNRSVTDRLRTYGEVGSQLSGGLDSGAVVSFAARALKKRNKKLNTYSFIPESNFKDWTSKYFVSDERPFIKETVNFVGNINDHYLDFPGKNAFLEIESFLQINEMPYKFFENSFWLSGINEYSAKNGTKILLNGARGNFSISWGSIEINLNYYAKLLRKMKLIHLYKELDLYCKNFSTGKSNVLPAVIKKGFPILNMFLMSEKSFGTDEFPKLISNSLEKRTNVYEKLDSFGFNNDHRNRNNLFNIRDEHFEKLFFWNKTGTASTKLSLRNSLWERDPTNDLRVIRYCLSIPEDQYSKRGLDRSLIRRATKGVLPEKVRFNNKSRGIQSADLIHRLTPVWKQFIDELHQVSTDDRIGKYINQTIVKNVVSKYENIPRPEYIFNTDFRALTRCLVFYRFIKSLN
ncbi:asparagine synthase-related protein [Fredinandcohnia sp. 179-A 10B2 NHS]|uniref:asparagine synthase-related protein n=1 Tax=Fredinandcohnia sp. 179-A 10B2 NHS TaxID=3235176 RepID=UPI0039A213A8